MITQHKLLKILIATLTLFLLSAVIVLFILTQSLRDEGIIEAEDESLILCEELGCPTGTLFVGSANSNVYHECDCTYALTILPENRLCFLTSSEAEDKGYRPGSCVDAFQ